MANGIPQLVGVIEGAISAYLKEGHKVVSALFAISTTVVAYVSVTVVSTRSESVPEGVKKEDEQSQYTNGQSPAFVLYKYDSAICLPSSKMSTHAMLHKYVSVRASSRTFRAFKLRGTI